MAQEFGYVFTPDTPLRLYKPRRADVAPVGTLIMQMFFFTVFSTWIIVGIHIMITAPELEVIHSEYENHGSEAEGSTQLIPVGSRRILWVENAYWSTALAANSKENSPEDLKHCWISVLAIVGLMIASYVHMYLFELEACWKGRVLHKLVADPKVPARCCLL